MLLPISRRRVSLLIMLLAMGMVGDGTSESVNGIGTDSEGGGCSEGHTYYEFAGGYECRAGKRVLAYCVPDNCPSGLRVPIGKTITSGQYRSECTRIGDRAELKRTHCVNPFEKGQQQLMEAGQQRQCPEGKVRCVYELGIRSILLEVERKNAPLKAEPSGNGCVDQMGRQIALNQSVEFGREIRRCEEGTAGEKALVLTHCIFGGVRIRVNYCELPAGQPLHLLCLVEPRSGRALLKSVNDTAECPRRHNMTVVDGSGKLLEEREFRATSPIGRMKDGIDDGQNGAGGNESSPTMVASDSQHDKPKKRSRRHTNDSQPMAGEVDDTRWTLVEENGGNRRNASGMGRPKVLNVTRSTKKGDVVRRTLPNGTTILEYEEIEYEEIEYDDDDDDGKEKGGDGRGKLRKEENRTTMKKKNMEEEEEAEEELTGEEEGEEGKDKGRRRKKMRKKRKRMKGLRGGEDGEEEEGGKGRGNVSQKSSSSKGESEVEEEKSEKGRGRQGTRMTKKKKKHKKRTMAEKQGEEEVATEAEAGREEEETVGKGRGNEWRAVRREKEAKKEGANEEKKEVKATSEVKNEKDEEEEKEEEGGRLPNERKRVEAEKRKEEGGRRNVGKLEEEKRGNERKLGAEESAQQPAADGRGRTAADQIEEQQRRERGDEGTFPNEPEGDIDGAGAAAGNGNSTPRATGAEAEATTNKLPAAVFADQPMVAETERSRSEDMLKGTEAAAEIKAPDDKSKLGAQTTSEPASSINAQPSSEEAMQSTDQQIKQIEEANGEEAGTGQRSLLNEGGEEEGVDGSGGRTEAPKGATKAKMLNGRRTTHGEAEANEPNKALPINEAGQLKGAHGSLPGGIGMVRSDSTSAEVEGSQEGEGHDEEESDEWNGKWSEKEEKKNRRRIKGRKRKKECNEEKEEEDEGKKGLKLDPAEETRLVALLEQRLGPILGRKLQIAGGEGSQSLGFPATNNWGQSVVPTNFDYGQTSSVGGAWPNEVQSYPYPSYPPQRGTQSYWPTSRNIQTTWSNNNAPSQMPLLPGEEEEGDDEVELQLLVRRLRDGGASRLIGKATVTVPEGALAGRMLARAGQWAKQQLDKLAGEAQQNTKEEQHQQKQRLLLPHMRGTPRRGKPAKANKGIKRKHPSGNGTRKGRRLSGWMRAEQAMVGR